MNGDINGIIDIEIIIDDFIKRLKKDKFLSNRLDIYINIDQIYSFWNMLLFAKGHFKGKPFKQRLAIVLEERHFNKLIFIFNKSVDLHYAGTKANLAKSRARALVLFYSLIIFKK